MLIDISGSRCISCRKYTQYYTQKQGTNELQPINCGYCGQRQCTTKPGNRCKHYQERGNVGARITHDNTKHKKNPA